MLVKSAATNLSLAAAIHHNACQESGLTLVLEKTVT